MAYSILALKPSEFYELTPMEFEKMVQGYDLRTRIEDARTAYMTSLIVNVQLDKKNQIKVKDIMKDLHPPTRLDRKKEEMEFMREWLEEGVSCNGRRKHTRQNKRR